MAAPQKKSSPHAEGANHLPSTDGDVVMRRRKRVRLVKRLMRYLPRKADLEHYPILGRFAKSARKSAFLWSFRSQEVIPAFLAGWVICLMPIMGVQLVVAVAAAFLFRANIIILAALQFITTVFTVPFIWPILYKIGQGVVHLLGNRSSPLPTELHQDAFVHASEWFMRATATTTLGGILVGYVLAGISCISYEIFMRYLNRERKLHREYMQRFPRH